jgi:hypothetical protein
MLQAQASHQIPHLHRFIRLMLGKSIAQPHTARLEAEPTNSQQELGFR